VGFTWPEQAYGYPRHARVGRSHKESFHNYVSMSVGERQKMIYARKPFFGS
jgi:hypothetical protein